MPTSTLSRKAAAMALAAIFSASVSYAQAPQAQFPIASLGGCDSRSACHAYCDDPAHMQACTDYAKQSGMISQSQADDAQAFASILAKGQGPGGCSTPDACDAYCSTIANMSSCIDFAKANGFSTPDIAIGEKMLAYIKSGGHMPGECMSKKSCMAYCDQPSHMQECQTDFEAAGVGDVIGPHGNGQGMPGGSGPSAAGFEQAHKSFQGPGNCTSKESCDAYCSDPSHQAECQAVFEKMGNWQIGSSTGQSDNNGTGPMNGQPGQQSMPSPGNCDSEASCNAYCSDPSHQAECQADFQKMGNWQAGTPSQNYNGSTTGE
ncbi:MAG: hypothetical protein KGI69_01250 [Patescibacteria group bacterium]|nr:hypothetical protein [Patescibacteria group bacterium]